MPDDTDGQSQNGPTDEQALDQKIGNIVNSAVTAHLKRFTEKSLPDLLTGALKPLTEKMATFQAPPPPADEDKSKGKKREQDPETLAALKAVEDLKKELQIRDEKVAAAEKKSRDERAYSSLRSSLDGKVRPELADMLAKNLFYVENRIEFDESGNPLFKTVRQPAWSGADPEEIKLPLASGIDDFLKSESAKAFLPAPNSGAGSTPLPKRGSTPNMGGTDFSKPATTDAEKTRRAAERERIAHERLGKR